MPPAYILGSHRDLLPLSVTCEYSDADVDLVRYEAVLLYLCVIVFTVCAGATVKGVGGPFRFGSVRNRG